MDKHKFKPGMLTYKDECSEAPAGLGSTVYVCRADGMPLTAVNDCKLHKIDLTDDGIKKEEEHKHGFSITATATFEEPKMSVGLKRLLYPRVRLPRKEKKRRLNYVMRQLQLSSTIIILNSFSPETGCLLALSLLFPDRLPPRTVVIGRRAITITPTQGWLLRLLTKRLSCNARRILIREGGLRLVGRTTSDGGASAEIVVTRAQADRLRRLIALEHLDRKEEELLYGKEG